MTGLVVRNTGFWYMVLPDGKRLKEEAARFAASGFDDGHPVADGLVPCKVKGNFRLRGIRTTNPVAVGDCVEYEMNREGFAFINKIHTRRNYIIRRATNLSKQAHILATNLDQLLLLLTVAHPETSTNFIDRFLATAEAYNVPACLVINKIDLYNEEERHYADSLAYLYRSIGYPVLFVSVQTGEGLPVLQQQLAHKTTLIAGNSGVGKSSLINRLIPEAHARTAALSETYDLGTHTTTFSEMYEAEPDAFLIDTPGIRGFGTIEFAREDVGHYFPEIFKMSSQCRFGNCTHTHEPGCAVVPAVEAHLISQSRYESYLSILDDEQESKYRE